MSSSRIFRLERRGLHSWLSLLRRNRRGSHAARPPVPIVSEWLFALFIEGVRLYPRNMICLMLCIRVSAFMLLFNVPVFSFVKSLSLLISFPDDIMALTASMFSNPCDILTSTASVFSDDPMVSGTDGDDGDVQEVAPVSPQSCFPTE